MTTETFDANQRDARFKYEVVRQPGGENLLLCYACGTCTAGCPVSQIDPEFNPRKIIRQILLGMRREVLSSPVIWRCAQCHACTAKCPQNVRFREIMRALWQLAVAHGFAPPHMLERIDELARLTHKARRDLVAEFVRNPEAFELLKEKCEHLTQTTDQA